MAAPTLENTLSDEFANSYVDVEYADDYWSGHYSTVKSDAWVELSTQQKTSLLLQACRTLETIRFTDPVSSYSANNPITGFPHATMYGRDRTPSKYILTQALQFPRNLDINTADSTTYIPESIMMAQCEQALYILTFDDSTIASKLQGVNRESVTLGPLKVSTTLGQLGSSLCPVALDLIRPFIIKNSTSIGRG